MFLFSDDAMAGIVTELTVPEDGHAVDVRLEPCATIRGRYVYAGGVPAADIHNFPKFVLDPTEGPDLSSDDDQIHNLAFYNNFARVSMRGKSDKNISGEDGSFELTGIVPGVHIYLSLNYKFEPGDKLFRDVGALCARRNQRHGRFGHQIAIAMNEVVTSRWPHDPAEAWLAWQPVGADRWDLAKVLRMHRRAGFGATWAEAQRDLADGHEAAIARLLAVRHPWAPMGARPRRSTPLPPRCSSRIASIRARSMRSARRGSIA